MIGIPEGTRVYGMQLPIQAQSLMIVADWERDAGVDELARVIRHADEHGFHYVGVCDHIALTEDYASRMGTFWQDCIGTLSWAAGITTRTNLLSHAYVLPYRHPLVAAKQFATLDYLSGGRASSGSAPVTCSPSSSGSTSTSTGGASSSTRSCPCSSRRWSTNGSTATAPARVRSSSRAHRCGWRGRARRRSAAPRQFADGWLPQGPSDAGMVAALQEAREQHGRAGRADDDRAHHAVALRRQARLGRARRLAHRRRRPSSPSRSSPAPPRA